MRKRKKEKEMDFVIPLETFSRIRTRRPTWYPSKYIRPCRCDDEETYGDKDDAPDEREMKRGEKRKREERKSRESCDTRTTLKCVKSVSFTYPGARTCEDHRRTGVS